MIWSCVAEYRKNEPSKFPFGNSEVAQKREPPGSLFCFIGNASYEIKTPRTDRTAAEWKNVACATRRRRRILLRRILSYFIGKTAYGALLN